jgi:WD40 repeat protein
MSALYSFAVDEGPIWSIRFHPRGMITNERIGLLGVATANQNILVYSLPYLKTSDKSSSSVIISIKSILICKLSEQVILYQDNYLLQATALCWHHQENFNLLAGGYVNGLIAIWKLKNEHDIKRNEENSVFPYMMFQPHLEMVTTIDFKYTLSKLYMLTASMDRKVKVFAISAQYEEINTYLSSSRVSTAEWWINWPGYLVGIDNCYSSGGVVHRSTLEFGMRNTALLQSEPISINDMSINHWLNYVAAVTASGEVFCFGLPQMLRSEPKKKWEAYKTHIASFTDYSKISEKSETGLVFNDSKVSV